LDVGRPSIDRLRAALRTRFFMSGEFDMPNGLVIKHRTRGYLADFDPWGKQEFVWTVDIKRAWVFSSEQDANAAIRWMPRENQLSIKRLLP
jgi:hypothetical protein